MVNLWLIFTPAFEERWVGCEDYDSRIDRGQGQGSPILEHVFLCRFLGSYSWTASIYGFEIRHRSFGLFGMKDLSKLQASKSKIGHVENPCPMWASAAGWMHHQLFSYLLMSWMCPFLFSGFVLGWQVLITLCQGTPQPACNNYCSFLPTTEYNPPSRSRYCLAVCPFIVWWKHWGKCWMSFFHLLPPTWVSMPSAKGRLKVSQACSRIASSSVQSLLLPTKSIETMPRVHGKDQIHEYVLHCISELPCHRWYWNPE